MKILYVCRLYSGFSQSLEAGIWNPKGAPTIARMIEHIDQSDHEFSIILVPKGADQSQEIKTYYLDGLSTPITVITGSKQFPKWMWKFRDKFADLYQLIQIYSAYRKFKPDLVYCDRVNIFPAAMLSRFTKAKVIWRIMGILEQMHIAAESHDLRSRYLKWLWRSPFETTICTLDGSGGGPWMKKNIRKDVPQHLLLNGVKKDMVPIAMDNIPDKGVKMLFVGRLESLKGIEEFLDAFYTVADNMPYLHAVIGGGGSLKNTLEQQAKEKGMEARVHFLGELTPSQLKDVRQKSDFYVSLNKQANLSNVNLEALSDFLPTIVPSSKPKYGVDIDTDNMIPSDVFYRFGKVGDMDALITAIEFMCDPKNRKTYRENAKKCADEILPTWNQRIQTEMNIFEACINRKPIDTAIVISDLGSGGAQKVATSLANDLGNSKPVTLITLSDDQNDFFQLSDNVNRIALDINSESPNPIFGALSNIGRVLTIRSALKRLKPKTTISFIAPTNVLTVLATIGLKTKTIISERNDPARQSFGKLWDTLRRHTYRFADVVTANSPNAVASLREYVPEEKLVFVPNALPLPHKKYVVPYNKKENTILIVGRLHPQKAHHILIDAFSKVHAKHPDWSLVIVGDGALRETLERQTKALNLSDCIHFEGTSDTPYEYYSKAKIYVLPSLHEGTPNSLIEAMSCGVAPIISDACEGALPYIENEKSGLTFPVQNVDELAQAISRLIDNPNDMENMATMARESVAPLFEKTTLDLWKETLEK